MTEKTIQEYLTSIEESLAGIVGASRVSQKMLFVGIRPRKNGPFYKSYLTSTKQHPIGSMKLKEFWNNQDVNGEEDYSMPLV